MMKHIYPKMAAILAGLPAAFSGMSLGSPWVATPSAPPVSHGFNGHLPCNKRQQRKAKALRAKRRARRLGHA